MSKTTWMIGGTMAGLWGGFLAMGFVSVWEITAGAALGLALVGLDVWMRGGREQ